MFSAPLRRKVRRLDFRIVAAYGLVSVLAFCLELVLLRALLQSGASQVIAVSCAFTSACVFQFLVLRYGVFRAANGAMIFQANKFVALAAISWFSVVLGVAILTRVLHIGTLAARVALLPVLFPVNYLASRYVVFTSGRRNAM